MASVEVKTHGFEQALELLSVAVGASALRSAAFAGATVFKQELIDRAPVVTGLLKSQVIAAYASDRSSGAQRQTYVVRIRSGGANLQPGGRRERRGRSQGRDRGRGAQPIKTATAYYWRLVEFGTSKASAQPFIRPSWEARRAYALQVMRDRLWQRVQEALGSRP